MQPLPRIERSELIARLSKERRGLGPRCAIALDADGTLWSGDVGHDLFKAALAERALRPQARAALAEEARGSGLSVGADDDANEIGLRLISAWATGAYGDDRAFLMMSWAFAGHDQRGLLEFAARALDRAGLAQRFHETVREVVDWAHEAGVEVWVVSASPRAAVEVGVRALGIAAERVVAVTPVTRGGVLTSELQEPVPFDHGKPLALAAAAPGVALLGAFGDSSFDAALLRAARVAVAVDPHPRLRALQPSIPNLVELALHPPSAEAS